MQLHIHVPTKWSNGRCPGNFSKRISYRSSRLQHCRVAAQGPGHAVHVLCTLAQCRETDQASSAGDLADCVYLTFPFLLSRILFSRILHKHLFFSSETRRLSVQSLGQSFVKMQTESVHEIGKGDPHVQGVALQDFDDAGDLQGERPRYDPRHDERDMVRLGKRQELKVRTLPLSAATIRTVRLTSGSVVSASSPLLAM